MVYRGTFWGGGKDVFPHEESFVTLPVVAESPKRITPGGPRLGEGGRLGECWEVARSQHGGTLRGGVHAWGVPVQGLSGQGPDKARYCVTHL